jgi:hypothetical protein
MNRKSEAVLDVAVKKSLGFNPIEIGKWSIVECAHNDFLDPEYDPILDLKNRLQLQAFIEKYKLGKGYV